MSEKIFARLGTMVSFTIAMLTLFSGLLGWQLGNISREASEEYSRAQRAELNRQKVASSNTLKAYEDYRAFLVYKNYFEQYKLVSMQLETAREEETPDENLIAQLATKRDELEALYLSSLRLFPNQFISRDGSYNLQEQLGQLNATEGRKLDTYPDTFQKRGEQYDIQVGKMQIALITLAVSLFFFAIVSTVEGLNRVTALAFIVIGYLTATAGVAMGISNWKPVLLKDAISSDPSQQMTSTLIATNSQAIIADTPSPTTLPTETLTPTLIAATGTPTEALPPPQTPSLETWDFFCNAVKKEMGVNIFWVDTASNEDGYRIIRNGEVAAELPANASSYKESIPLTTGIKIKYQIEAFNSGGSSFSIEFSFTC